MTRRVEMDATVTLHDQFKDRGGPVVLINKFEIPPGDADRFLAAWAGDAAFMKRQPGFISTQLHRGVAGSGVFMNVAVWDSAEHFHDAVTHPEFAGKLGEYPADTVTSPHLFRRVAVSGICTA